LSDHLTEGDAQRFVRGELSRPKTTEVLRHLLRGCEVCRKQLRPLILKPEAPRPSAGREYEAPIARALASVLSRRPEARGVNQTLVARGVELIRANPLGLAGLTDEEADELRGRPLVHAFLRLSFDERYRNPVEMLRLALFAKIAAQNLNPQEHAPEVIADEQARAWAEMANAHRVNDELAAADAALEIAEERRRQGTGNLLLLARLADLQASLFAHQRLLPDACELLDGVCQLYQKVGDDHLAGRALVSRGIYTNYEGQPRQALGFLRRGFALLDRERDPQLVISATESILEVMVQCGEYTAAAEMLLESGLREAWAGQPISLSKLRWVEGQIFAGLGKTGRAEAALQEARAGFLQHNRAFPAALVGLDLAAVWLGQGKRAEVKELAEDMLATFERLGIQREAVRAMGYLKRACERQRATPRTVRHVSGFLRRLEREPQLRFEAL